MPSAARSLRCALVAFAALCLVSLSLAATVSSPCRMIDGVYPTCSAIADYDMRNLCTVSYNQACSSDDVSKSSICKAACAVSCYSSSDLSCESTCEAACPTDTVTAANKCGKTANVYTACTATGTDVTSLTVCGSVFSSVCTNTEINDYPLCAMGCARWCAVRKPGDDTCLQQTCLPHCG